MKCVGCGRALPRGAKKCPSCGRFNEPPEELSLDVSDPGTLKLVRTSEWTAPEGPPSERPRARSRATAMVATAPARPKPPPPTPGPGDAAVVPRPVAAPPRPGQDEEATEFVSPEALAGASLNAAGAIPLVTSGESSVFLLDGLDASSKAARLDEVLELALRTETRGRPHEAIQMLERGLRVERRAAHLHQLARLYAGHLGDVDRAELLLDEARRIDPNNPNHEVALSFVRTGRAALACPAPLSLPARAWEAVVAIFEGLVALFRGGWASLREGLRQRR